MLAPLATTVDESRIDLGRGFDTSTELPCEWKMMRIRKGSEAQDGETGGNMVAGGGRSRDSLAWGLEDKEEGLELLMWQRGKL